jgi:hypothetical protein
MLSLAGMIGAIEFQGCTESTHPQYSPGQPAGNQSSVSSSIAIDELTAAHTAGVPVDSSDGVFSIGWDPFVGPIAPDSARTGDASALVFDTVSAKPRYWHSAIDIGAVYLDYSGTQLELQRVHHFFGGVMYSLFPHLWGQNNQSLEFIPNTSYEFDVTGSSLFPAAKVSITSPAALISITTPANGAEILPDSDLTLAWSGGNPVAGVLIRVTPMIDVDADGFAPYAPGLRMRNGGIPPGIQEDHEGFEGIDTGYSILLASNAGKAVIPAAVIQNYYNYTADLSVTVSEFSTTEFNQDNRKYLVVMRDGDRRLVVIK